MLPCCLDLICSRPTTSWLRLRYGANIVIEDSIFSCNISISCRSHNFLNILHFFLYFVDLIILSMFSARFYHFWYHFLWFLLLSVYFSIFTVFISFKFAILLGFHRFLAYFCTRFFLYFFNLNCLVILASCRFFGFFLTSINFGYFWNFSNLLLYFLQFRL